MASNVVPLPNVPVPEAPTDPACEWCGARPAEPYEVAPPVTGTKSQADANGQVQTVKVLKKAATMVYACKEHRDLFDRRKAEAAQRADENAALRKKAKGTGERWVPPAI